MTGRELIIYILENNLEDVQLIDETGTANKCLCFIPIEKLAVKYHISLRSVEQFVKQHPEWGIFEINGKKFVFERR